MPRTEEDERPVKRRRRRAARACVFCRQRKLKCDNVLPVCSNCRTYDNECVYANTPAPSRPTNVQLAELRDENRRLRHKLGTLEEPSSAGLAGHDQVREEHESEQPSALRSPESTPVHARLEIRSFGGNGAGATTRPVGQQQQSVVSRIFISANGNPSYHGVTSTLFDESSTSRPSGQISVDPKMPVEWVQKGLMAEAARQQQLEKLNLHQGNLDFDGVDSDLGMHLLSLHWNRQHFSFLTTYRPAFMRDMACGGPYFSKLLLNAIYFGASKFSPRPEVRRDPDDVRTAGWVFRKRVKALLGDALDRSEITTIQALLVMTNSLFALGDERSAAWLYAGIAFRMITDLGIHIDATKLPNMRRLSDEDLEIRRRVFWAAFVVDKIQSLYQGRPVSLQYLESRVPLTFLDHYEEMEHWQPFAYTNNKAYAGSPAFGVSTFTELCKLSIILNDILNRVYSERSTTVAPTELIERLNALHSELVAWYDRLPPHLRYQPQPGRNVPPPHVLSLLAMYNVLLILLHRPFVADGHLHSTNPSIAIDSFSTCATAAFKITGLIRVYEQTFSIRRAPYLISYATYVAATILVRIAAQRDGDSEAHSGVRLCLSVFDQNQETNWAVRPARSVIRHLMERMGVSLAVRPQPQAEDSENNESITRDMAAQPPMVTKNAIQLPDNVGLSATNNSASTYSQMSGGKETDDLNMSMIIQSFFRQNSTNQRTSDITAVQNYQVACSQGQRQAVTGPAQYDEDDMISKDHGGNLMMGNCSNVRPDHLQEVPPLAAGDPLQAGSLSFDDTLFDDMLFGFNSAILDGVMWSTDCAPQQTPQDF